MNSSCFLKRQTTKKSRLLQFLLFAQFEKKRVVTPSSSFRHLFFAAAASSGAGLHSG
jgi:hypothetical protein